VIAQFAIRLICGMSLVWWLAPRKQITDGFFRIQMLIVLGLAVLAALLGFEPLGETGETSSSEADVLLGSVADTWLCSTTAVVAFLGSIAWALGRRRLGTSCIAAVTGLSLVLLIGPSWPSPPISSMHLLLVITSELATALLLGAAMVSMLLGHWYLTATGMSLTPLWRLNTVFGIATLLRIVLATTGLWLVDKLPGTDYHVTLLALRWLVGLLGPLVVVVMVWRILKYRNTQAATGVLYTGVLLTVTGELAATLLSRELSLPV
jgi:hypothetical protein